MIVSVALGVGLLVLGSRLLGPNPPDGVRAGVFTAFAGFLVVVGLARWASLWLEYWAYTHRSSFPPSTGAVVSAVIGGLLLVGWVRLFTRPAVQKQLLVLEHGGWFHATAYKSNQGQKVRRGTVFGILLLVGAGIYTMISHGTLRRGDPDLIVNIPFTGAVAVESVGDTEQFLKELPLADKDRVEIRSSGESLLNPKQIVSFKVYHETVDDLLKDKPELKAELDKAGKDGKGADEPIGYVLKQNQLTYEQMKKLLSLHVFKEDVVRKLKDVDQRTDMADLTELVLAYKQAAETAKKTDELGPLFRLPTGVVVVDRYALRDVNDKTDKSHFVKIGLPGDSLFKEGQIVSREDFDEAVAKLEAEKKKGRDRELPQELALTPASGKLIYASIKLLPAVQFTVPLILLGLSLWLAWRIVNMPTFADFLIATEAELNKVSWTTQKRLVQDTIVVLVTVALMSIFLFGMDWTWKVVLSWKPIGVLHIPKDQADTETKIDQKKW